MADTGDSAIGSADYAADAAMALTACAMGDSYCTKAMSDLSGKNQTVADSVSALMNGDTWEGIKTLAQKANEGDQLALEGMGGLMAGILVPGKKIPDVGAIIDVGKAEVTSGTLASGAENIATYPKLKDDLIQQNLNNIAKQDPRLAEAVKGSGSTNPNFGIGTGTSVDAERLGNIWVGDGATLVSNQKECPGCLKSADGTRIYRPPMNKPNAPAELNPTGFQANFVQMDGGKITSNGHMSIQK